MEMDSIFLNIFFSLVGLKNSNKQNPQKAYKYITVWPLLHNQIPAIWKAEKQNVSTSLKFVIFIENEAPQ